MGKVYEAIKGRLASFVTEQPVFFVATAPSGDDGHVNLSPKGGSGMLAVIGPREVAYLDYSGSGVETIAHLRQNGRITVMLCAFSGPPKIVRLYGRGEPVFRSDSRYATYRNAFAADLPEAGLRSIIRVEVERIADSCGYAVPFMDYAGERTLLWDDQERKGPEKMAEYRARKNAESVDGLPGLPSGV